MIPLYLSASIPISMNHCIRDFYFFIPDWFRAGIFSYTTLITMLTRDPVAQWNNSVRNKKLISCPYPMWAVQPLLLNDYPDNHMKGQPDDHLIKPFFSVGGRTRLPDVRNDF